MKSTNLTPQISLIAKRVPTSVISAKLQHYDREKFWVFGLVLCRKFSPTKCGIGFKGYGSQHFIQPSKLKFLLGCHMATNSFGLGRPFYKSSCQLQNFRHHGNQNGRNLEGCHPYPDIPKVAPTLLRVSGILILRTSKQITKAQTNHCCYLPFTFLTRPD